MTVLPFPARSQSTSTDRPSGQTSAAEPYQHPDVLCARAQAFVAATGVLERDREQLCRAVDVARRQGATWPEIADATGLSEGALRMMRRRWRARRAAQSGTTAAAQ